MEAVLKKRHLLPNETQIVDWSTAVWQKRTVNNKEKEDREKKYLHSMLPALKAFCICNNSYRTVINITANKNNGGMIYLFKTFLA